MITAEDVLKLRASIEERYLGELKKLNKNVSYKNNGVSVRIVNFTGRQEKLNVIRYTLYKRETMYYMDIYHENGIEYTDIKKIAEAFAKGFNNVTAEELEVLFL